MRFIKASERLPETNKHVVLKQGNQFYGVYYSEKHKMIYSLPTHHYWPTTDLETMEDLAWLDESIPASAVEEAEALYPDTDKKFDERVLNAAKRSAHITCAGMYTDTIDKLKNDVAKLEAENKALIEEIQNWKDELKDQAREHRNNR